MRLAYRETWQSDDRVGVEREHDEVLLFFFYRSRVETFG